MDALTPSSRDNAGRFQPGNTIGRRPRESKRGLMHYIRKKVGHDARAIVDELVRLAKESKSESIRLKASDMLLERGWGKTATVQPETNTQPLFNLPPGAHVAIAIKLPEPPPPPTSTSSETDT